MNLFLLKGYRKKNKKKNNKQATPPQTPNPKKQTNNK